MNQQLKQLIHTGPYKIDSSTVGVFTVRGHGHAAVSKTAMGVYNRKETIVITPAQAEAHALLVLEAFQVFALSGKTPMEMHQELSRR